MNGIAPNGVDGIMPTLAGTADTGTTSIPATPGAPAMTVYDNGAISGLLVPDNYNNYTFTYAAPPVRYQMGPAPNNKHIVSLQLPVASPFKFPGGQTTLQMESSQLPANQIGGFHVVVLDATTFKPLANATFVDNPNYCPGTCKSPDGTTVFSLDELPAQLQSLTSRGNLWFVGSIGNLSHNFPVSYNGQGNVAMQDFWDRAAQSGQDLAGTYATFAMLDNPALAQDDWDQYTKNTVPTNDDYNMVGQLWINASASPIPTQRKPAWPSRARQTSIPCPATCRAFCKKVTMASTGPPSIPNMRASCPNPRWTLKTPPTYPMFSGRSPAPPIPPDSKTPTSGSVNNC